MCSLTDRGAEHKMMRVPSSYHNLLGSPPSIIAVFCLFPRRCFLFFVFRVPCSLASFRTQKVNINRPSGKTSGPER